MTALWKRTSAGGAVFAVLAAATALSPIGALRVQSKLQTRVASELTKNEFPWATARADGRSIILSGTAPDAASLDASVKIVKEIPGVARVSAAEVAILQPIEEPPPEKVPPATAAPEPVQASKTSSAAADCQSDINRALNGRRLSFRHGSARLGAAERALLAEFAAALAKSCANRTIIIEGHTDATGPEAANLRLSERRARAVEAYLLQFGPATTLAVRAYGESRPIASNRSAEGRAANRRIDFVVDAAEPETQTESD